MPLLSFEELKNREGEDDPFANEENYFVRVLARQLNKIEELVRLSVPLKDEITVQGKYEEEVCMGAAIDFLAQFIAHHLARLTFLTKTYQGTLDVEFEDLAGNRMTLDQSSDGTRAILKIDVEYATGPIIAFRNFLHSELNEKFDKEDRLLFCQKIEQTSPDKMMSYFSTREKGNKKDALLLVQFIASLAHEIQHLRQLIFDPKLYEEATAVFDMDTFSLPTEILQEVYPEKIEAYQGNLAEIHSDKLSLRYLLYLRERARKQLFPVAASHLKALDEHIRYLKREIKARLEKSAAMRRRKNDEMGWIEDLK